MSTADKLMAMKNLFETWVEDGVPHGVEYPRTQSAAVGWSCPKYGIVGVGSKREFNTNHREHGAIVKQISALCKKLKPVEEVLRLRREKGEEAPKAKSKRVYTTQKARRVAAEDETSRVNITLKNTLQQLQQTRQNMASAERDLTIERQRVTELQKNVVRLGAEIAELKRSLAARSGVLHVVE